MAKISFQDRLVSDPGTFSNPQRPPEVLALDAQIRQHIVENGFIEAIEGALGDGINLTAYVKDVLEPGEGVFSKLYGISYLYPGRVDPKVIDSVAQMKRVFMATADLALKSPFRFVLPLVLFRPKKAAIELIGYFAELYEADLFHKTPPYRKFSKMARGLIKAACEAAALPIRLPATNDEAEEQGEFFESKSFRLNLHRLIFCVAMFFEFDLAYRLRAQDVLKNAWLANGVENPVGEVERLFNLAISREISIKNKLITLKKLTLWILRLSPQARQFVSDFFYHLTPSQFDFTEADWYYSLNRRGYNYDGKSIGWRQAEWERINREKGHVILGI